MTYALNWYSHSDEKGALETSELGVRKARQTVSRLGLTDVHPSLPRPPVHGIGCE